MLISVPNGSIGLDFKDAPPKNELTEDEVKIRKAIFAVFKSSLGNQRCFAIDVNHYQFEFKPNDLVIDDDGNPWPFRMTPWGEYLVIANAEFAHGVFCNPRNNHMVVFGEKLVQRFSEDFSERIVAAEVAAAHPASKK